jgi:broad specificity phosphatase PhoE
MRTVSARVTALILELERCIADTSLLLVSHGGALHILQTAFARLDASTPFASQRKLDDSLESNGRAVISVRNIYFTDDIKAVSTNAGAAVKAGKLRRSSRKFAIK